MWQEAIVGICVIAAVFFLARRWIFPPAKKTASCGGCGGCDKTNEPGCAKPAKKNQH